MRKDGQTNSLLLVIAVALVAIAARPYVSPTPVAAEQSPAHAYYIEPGVQMLRYPDGTGAGLREDRRRSEEWEDMGLSDGDCRSVSVVSAG